MVKKQELTWDERIQQMVNELNLSERAKRCRLDRILARHGLYLEKSRSRTPENPEFGMYRVRHADTGMAVAGNERLGFFSLTLEDVRDWLIEHHEEEAY